MDRAGLAWSVAVSSVPLLQSTSLQCSVHFTIRSRRRFPVQCFVTYNAGPFRGKAPCGISHVPTGGSPAICSCDRRKPSHWPTVTLSN